MNKAIRKLQSEHVVLKFPNIGNLHKCKIINYSDASYRNLPNEGSQGGFIIFLANEHNEVIPIQWQSRKIKRIVRSTLAAETLAQIDSSDSAYFIKSLLVEILHCNPQSIQIESFIDSKSLYDTLHTTKNVEDRSLRLSIAILREKLAKSEINKIHLVTTKLQIADCLTKNGGNTNILLNVLRTGILK